MSVPGDSGDRALAAAEAALGVPGVLALDAGPLGRLSTYHASGRVSGVRLVAGGGAEIGVVAPVGIRLPELARAVRAVVTPVTGAPVDVSVVDIRSTEEFAVPGSPARAREDAAP